MIRIKSHFHFCFADLFPIPFVFVFLSFFRESGVSFPCPLDESTIHANSNCETHFPGFRPPDGIEP